MNVYIYYTKENFEVSLELQQTRLHKIHSLNPIKINTISLVSF